jgi:orotate phosphoribosyltransferase
MALTTCLRSRVAHRVVRVLARTTYRLHDRSLPVQERGRHHHDGAAVHELEVHDVLSGGRSAGTLTQTLRAEGHTVQGGLFVFRFGNRTGTARLQQLGLTAQALATLHLPEH